MAGNFFEVPKSAGDFDAEGVGEVDLVFLFLEDDAAEGFAEGVFAKGFGPTDALAIVGDGFAFDVEVKARHGARG